MAIIGIGIDIWTPSINGGSRIHLPPGQAILFSRGQATVSFLANSPGTLAAAGAATVAFVGSTGGGGGFTPSYQFNDARNSMYATHV
jgi:hypothetical protein